jgi:cell division protein FtsL
MIRHVNSKLSYTLWKRETWINKIRTKLTKNNKGNEKYKQEINENITWHKIWTLQKIERKKSITWSWSENQDT